MWLFLLTEVMLFGGLFTMYVVYRWLYADSFAAGSRELNLWLGTVNTVVLIGSSLTMALAHQSATDNHRKRLLTFLGLTIALGLVFLGIKSVEYVHKFDERLVPGPGFAWHSDETESSTVGDVDETDPPAVKAGPQQVELFFGMYFVMTGLHALHMVIGLGVMLALIVAAGAGKQLGTAVEMTGLYWHFVDVVWIFLFPLLYLLGRH